LSIPDDSPADEPSATSPTRASIRVRYAETDQMGVGYHGAYLPWLEVARTRWLRNHALPYRELEAGGVHLPVIEVRCRYLQPVHYDDELVVEVIAQRYRRSGIGFGYRLLRPRDGALVATAETRHAAVGADGRVLRLPKAVRDALDRSSREPAPATPPRR
jgi:acyl-CoA thioester hydrolase